MNVFNIIEKLPYRPVHGMECIVTQTCRINNVLYREGERGVLYCTTRLRWCISPDPTTLEGSSLSRSQLQRIAQPVEYYNIAKQLTIEGMSRSEIREALLCIYNI